MLFSRWMKTRGVKFTLSLCMACAPEVYAQVSASQEAPPPAQTPAKMPYAGISGGVMAKLRVKYVAPVYPQAAIDAHIEGTVLLRVVVVNGIVVGVEADSGPDILRQAAVDAVKQWTYRTYLLNGQPAEVHTTVTVNFSRQPSQP
jgi:outer membrane biosynthesis protein TonB